MADWAATVQPARSSGGLGAVGHLAVPDAPGLETRPDEPGFGPQPSTKAASVTVATTAAIDGRVCRGNMLAL